MKTTTATAINQQPMKMTTAITIERPFLLPNYRSQINNSREIVNNLESDLDSIMAREFALGLPSDIDGADV